MKRFFAKDMRTALTEVKEVMGADAVIMSSKKVAGGIELVAGIDADAEAPAPAPQRAMEKLAQNNGRELADDQVNLSSFKEKLANLSAGIPATPAASASQSTERPADSLQSLLKRQQQNSVSTPAKAKRPVNPAFAEVDSRASMVATPTPAATAHNDEQIQALKEEMLAMRQLLEHQLSGLMKQEMDRTEPVRAMLVKQLTKMGIADDLADQFACYIGEDTTGREAWTQLQQLLTEQLVVTEDEILRQGGVVALVGPTGVGKTTTVAKLAARFAAQYGADQVALISTDSYRIGALDQLATYGRILGCPVRSAKNSDELADQLYQLRHRKLILIDTAGMGQRDMRLNEQLNTLITNSRVKIKSYLVLPATAQRDVMQEAIEQFRQIPLRGCIFTKLDECLSLGECISVAIQNAMPIGYLSDGQRVPEDLRVADASYLVKQAFTLAAGRQRKTSANSLAENSRKRHMRL
ncbi:flagellar biosynthesis protein FlhF [Neiella litorisoli]|nr:flagellar biosynthesis protein FlhF [Neiella litorisoli]